MLLAPIAIAFYAAFYAGAVYGIRIIDVLKFSIQADTIELESYAVIMADTRSLRASCQEFDEKEASLVV